jgi:endonuclease/exonuclease/phosphatase family metal-dependent hydrolase
MIKNRAFVSRLYWLAAFVIFLAVAAACMPYMISGQAYSVPGINELKTELKNVPFPEEPEKSKTVMVMTLNLAHGRGTGFSQLLLPKDRIEKNLDTVSEVIKKVNPDIAGFQEADGPSFWSGGYDHIQQISERSGFPFFIHGFHIDAPYLSYGTAIASKLEVKDPVFITFQTAPFLPPKGFSAMSFIWPGTDQAVDLIVLHLDFMSESSRNRQIDEVAAFAEKKGHRPMIVMGDFNCSWDSKDSSVKKLCTLLRLKAYKPDERTLATFPLTGSRIDWILLSDQMNFKSYRVIEDIISEHLAVAGEIELSVK